MQQLQEPYFIGFLFKNLYCLKKASCAYVCMHPCMCYNLLTITTVPFFTLVVELNYSHKIQYIALIESFFFYSSHFIAGRYIEGQNYGGTCRICMKVSAYNAK